MAYNSTCSTMSTSVTLGALTSSIRGTGRGGHYKQQIDLLIPNLIVVTKKQTTTLINRSLLCVLGIPVAQLEKEPHWWVVHSDHWQNSHLPSLKHIAMYFFNFAKVSSLIGNSSVKLPLITIDSTPNIMFDWPSYYDREPAVNYCLLPAIIPEILPESRFIVIMRNPVEMMYSAFWYSCTLNDIDIPHDILLQGPMLFHNRVVTKLRQFDNCLKHYSLEWCVVNITYNLYSPELKCGRTRLEMGIYYVHVQKWLSIVPQEHFLFLTMEEVSVNLQEVGSKLWQFIGIPGKFEGLHQFESDKNEQTTINYRDDPRLHIRQETENLLRDFFQPSNQKLAHLLGDRKFLWEDK